MLSQVKYSVRCATVLVLMLNVPFACGFRFGFDFHIHFLEKVIIAW